MIVAPSRSSPGRITVSARRRHRRRTGAAPRAEAGVTVVEMIVATFIIGVAIAGAGALIVGAARTAEVGEQRTTASEIGVAEIERIRALPYAAIGIDPTHPDHVPSFDGDPTVSLATGALVEPTGQVVVDGVSFDLVRHVTWQPIDVGGSPVAEGFKAVAVSVAWTDAAGDHQIWHETAVSGAGS